MSAALIMAAVQTGVGLMNMFTQISAAKTQARAATAQARTDWMSAQYAAAVAERDAAEEYARTLAEQNNMYGAAGIRAGTGSAAMNAAGAYEAYKRDRDVIGLNKSLAELNAFTAAETASAQKKASTAGAVLNFTANAAGSMASALSGMSEPSSSGSSVGNPTDIRPEWLKGE